LSDRKTKRAARRGYHKAPAGIQRAFDKQSRLLRENLNHPSLHAKKYHEGQDLWQARVNDDWRLEEMKRHPK
jgi:mRNA-degrading endonuclease RelE of RelBE toxin-antitoxin system